MTGAFLAVVEIFGNEYWILKEKIELFFEALGTQSAKLNCKRVQPVTMSL